MFSVAVAGEFDNFDEDGQLTMVILIDFDDDEDGRGDFINKTRSHPTMTGCPVCRGPLTGKTIKRYLHHHSNNKL